MDDVFEKRYRRLRFMKFFQKKKYMYVSWCSAVTNAMSIVTTLLDNLHRVNIGEVNFSEVSPIVNDYIAAVSTWRKHNLFHASIEMTIDNLMVEFINTVVEYSNICNKSDTLEIYRRMFSAMESLRDMINDSMKINDVDFEDVDREARQRSFIVNKSKKTLDLLNDIMTAEVRKEMTLQRVFENVAQTRGYLMSDFLEISEGVDIVAERRKKIKPNKKKLFTITFTKVDNKNIGKVKEEECD